MSKPEIHAKNSVRRYGGVIEDYMPLHQLMDKSKSTIADDRHRCLTHNSWFISEIIERIFGVSFVNSSGRTVQWRDVAEQHVSEDYAGKFIPSASDWLQEIPMRDWMINGKRGVPPSFKVVDEQVGKVKTTRKVMRFDND